jgi:hypothetical protein
MARGAVQIFRVAAKGTAEEVRRALIATAKREHARIMTTEPRPTRFTRQVDGVMGSREEQVKQGGIIRYRYPRVEQAVQFAMETLFDLSPVLSGEYRNAHSLFVNGASATNLRDWDGTGEVVITNPLPYSRKIEVGRMTMRVPGSDRVYQQAVQLVRRRFGNQVNVNFTFRGIVGGAMPDPMADPPLLKRARGAKGRFVKSGAARAYNNRNLRFPALVITSKR